MVWYGVFLLAVGLVSALPNQKLHPLSDEFIEEINRKQSTWKAGRNFEIDEYELFKTLASGVRKSNRTSTNVQIHNEVQAVPESFDARKAWPECADVIGMIRDQSKCGSCWAISSVSVMSDRICIHSNATKKVLVSAQNLITCGNAGNCAGGSPFFAWSYWERSGIVTGGLYNRTDQGCQSYFLPPCEDHLNKCGDHTDTPKCSKECDDPNLSYTSQLTYGKDSMDVSGENQIQSKIMKYGPVVAVMDIYEDFANYKSGIYQHVSGDIVSGHAVRVLGWGIEEGVKYWLVANSWNEGWGENGFFRILRGKNEADIESEISYGLPDFSRF